ncbi:alpha/beta hydrolase [Aeromicrobium sp. YIM 150415]|uniref:alpha/beta hydrolase n=1 Tax=Aeromicrobium sp. YIM 150415 TaxID=2803912 RepID=UPI00196311D7|nr:alpha/beta hydrolase [Aeromicrobium sp. YIM 150415]MBM9462524.1 alpha/beta hydrolase [Aeromicrobium sp. YIM 150415]
MTTLVMALSALLAFSVVLALWPARANPLVATISFYAGVATSELPLQVLALTVFLLASTVALGEISVVAVLLLGCSLLGGVALLGRALAARNVLESAVRAVGGIPARRPRPWASLAFRPWPRLPRGVERHGAISYGPYGEANRLDLYRRRRRPPGPAPVLVHVHGGSFRRGRRSQDARMLLYRLARRGWVTVSPDYRLLPAGEFPANADDIVEVVTWLRTHAEELDVDPERIVLVGSSAGAHLAVLSTLRGAQVRALVGLYGYYGAQRTRSDVPSDPTRYPADQAPLTLLVHGDADSFVDISGARRYAEHRRMLSGDTVALAELPGAQHGFDRFASLRFSAVCDAIEDFAHAAFSR